MGTVVFPDARWKFYLDASPDERARRRQRDFDVQGREVSAEVVREEIEARDRMDSARQEAPLTQAADAVYVDTTDRTADQIVEEIFRVVRGGD